MRKSYENPSKNAVKEEDCQCGLMKKPRKLCYKIDVIEIADRTAIRYIEGRL